MLILCKLPGNVIFHILHKLPARQLILMRKTCSYLDSFVEDRRTAFSLGLDLTVSVKKDNTDEFSISFSHRKKSNIAFCSTDNIAAFQKRIFAIPIQTIALQYHTLSPKILEAFKKLHLQCNHLNLHARWPLEEVFEVAEVFNVKEKISFTCDNRDAIEVLEILKNHRKREKFDVILCLPDRWIAADTPIFDYVKNFYGFYFRSVPVCQVLPQDFNKILWDIYYTKERCNLRYLKCSISLTNATGTSFPYVPPDVAVAPIRKIWDTRPFLMENTHERLYMMETDVQSVVISLSFYYYADVQIVFTEKRPSAVLDVILKMLQIRHFSRAQRESYLKADDDEKIDILNSALSFDLAN